MRIDRADDSKQRFAVAQVALQEPHFRQLGPHPGGRLAVGAADEGGDVIPLVEQQLRKQGTVLTRDPGDERALHAGPPEVTGALYEGRTLDS